ncbi:serine-type peptidase [Grosmannia clavigera kw1407]|uniref:Serine-type peptidase n=1 Tax=Grosmannia clavigera (strain kw1407 / UAMH 11150) TaxID=655863 RepID=F0XLH9_GROCL|nr:serine-type peptidase [Grosmannia clavigera kw1407]EFX01073.1 serine-type peptidase [Grosmannia clavigera kw1407]
MMLTTSLAALLAACATPAMAFLSMPKLRPPMLVDESFESMTERGVLDGRAASVYKGQTTFQQLLDHKDPSQGTFSQRFWWSTQYWGGPGSPVVFFTPGEEPATNYTGYLTNRTITGQFAQAIGGAVVMLEHRYWGESSPFDDLTTKNMRFLTLANSIADVTHFARTVELPFDTNGTSNAPTAPWVMSGGSYGGALAAYIEHVDPGTFWAYHASSAPVQVIEDFWQYFEPVIQGLPQNCSADLQLVIPHIDDVLANGTTAEIQALKDKFGLGTIEHSDDFVVALENGPWDWQESGFDADYSPVYEFCDYVENSVASVFDSATAGAEGVGLEKALDGYAKWTSEVLLPGNCESYGYFSGELNTVCFETYNGSNPVFTDTRVDNPVGRQWTWILCNEPFGFWQDGAPDDMPTIVSRLSTKAYWERQCALYFPTEDGYTYGQASGATADKFNAYGGGWSVENRTRLIWTNGEFDPWKDATMSSENRPGGPLVSTSDQPVNVIPAGVHCSDLIYDNGLDNAGAMAVIQKEIAVIKAWVEEFYTAKNKAKRSQSFQA